MLYLTFSGLGRGTQRPSKNLGPLGSKGQKLYVVKRKKVKAAKNSGNSLFLVL